MSKKDDINGQFFTLCAVIAVVVFFSGDAGKFLAPMVFIALVIGFILNNNIR